MQVKGVQRVALAVLHLVLEVVERRLEDPLLDLLQQVCDHRALEEVRELVGQHELVGDLSAPVFQGFEGVGAAAVLEVALHVVHVKRLSCRYQRHEKNLKHTLYTNGPGVSVPLRPSPAA